MVTVNYNIINYDEKQPHRAIEVQATQEQLDSFAAQGYLVLEHILTPGHLEQLRAALMEVVARENKPGKTDTYGKAYGGIYARGLLDKHTAFHSLLNFPPVTSIVRAMLGPRIQISAFSGRVTYPGGNQETKWHIDNRSWIDPMPPFYNYPNTINCLYYLDDLTPETGGLGVVPGTHLHSDPPPDDFRDISGEVIVYVPAGSVVLTNCGIWHRGRANRPGGGMRRNLLVGHSPIWMKQAKFDGFAETGGPLTQPLLNGTDPVIRELLGGERGLG
jgi:hypothetical protein